MNQLATQKNWIDRYFNWIKVAIMLCAYGYLIYTLVNFQYYNEFADGFRHIDANRIIYLVGALLLIFANWTFEALKWKSLLTNLQPSTFGFALKSVLIGLTAGFFTPNRIGEPAGRAMLLQDSNRLQGIALMLVGVMGQTFASLIYGLVGGMGLLNLHPHISFIPMGMWFGIGIFLLVTISLVYFLLPCWGKWILTGSYPAFIRFMWEIRTGLLRIDAITNGVKSIVNGLKPYLNATLSVSYPTLLKVTLYSLIRYGVYCLQYFFMLRFFDIQIDTLTTLLVIPLNYLVVSATPSISFSEIGVRGSCAILLLGAFTDNTLGLSLAAISVWFINYVCPMLTGSVLLLLQKKQ